MQLQRLSSTFGMQEHPVTYLKAGLFFNACLNFPVPCVYSQKWRKIPLNHWAMSWEVNPGPLQQWQLIHTFESSLQSTPSKKINQDFAISVSREDKKNGFCIQEIRVVSLYPETGYVLKITLNDESQEFS